MQKLTILLLINIYHFFVHIAFHAMKMITNCYEKKIKQKTYIRNNKSPFVMSLRTENEVKRNEINSILLQVVK